MAFDLNQQRAKEDQYFLYMAICIIAITISAFPLYAHIGGAVKYLLLRYNGEVTIGEITSIEGEKNQTIDDLELIMLIKNSNSITGFTHVNIRFSANNSPAKERKLILSEATEDMLNREPIELVYLPSQPNVFLPTELLAEMKADVHVAGFLGLVLLTACFGLFLAHWRWRNFLFATSQYGKHSGRA